MITQEEEDALFKGIETTLPCGKYPCTCFVEMPELDTQMLDKWRKRMRALYGPQRICDHCSKMSSVYSSNGCCMPHSCLVDTVLMRHDILLSEWAKDIPIRKEEDGSEEEMPLAIPIKRKRKHRRKRAKRFRWSLEELPPLFDSYEEMDLPFDFEPQTEPVFDRVSYRKKRDELLTRMIAALTYAYGVGMCVEAAVEDLTPPPDEQVGKRIKRLNRKLDEMTNSFTYWRDSLAYKMQTVEMDMVAQTDQIFDQSAAPDVASHQNVEFHDETEGVFEGFSAPNDPVAMNDQSAGIELRDFLRRPVLIQKITYADTDSPPNQITFQPWWLYMNSAPIQRKLSNFGFIKGNLHVKAVVNATNFVMGAYLFDYQPLTDLTPSTIVGTTLSTFIQRTQRPHMICYMSESQGGEMVCPFVYNRDWLPLSNSAEIKQMGTITGSEMQALSSSNGATGIAATINVFAWMEDVELHATTLNLAAQAGTEYDPERPLSTTASAVAAAAGQLERIPIIGRFATATKMGAALLAKGFAAFGFTNVPIISGAEPMRPAAAPPLATTEIGFPYESLTVDPKNELGVGQVGYGLGGEDPLAILAIVKRESYLTQFSWSDAAAEDTLLYNMGISPMCWDAATVTGAIKLSPTPMGWLSDLFLNWHGDLLVRVKAVKTVFHKGRLRITFDPQGDLTSGADFTTVSYTEFMDLATMDEVTLRIPYRQAYRWLSTYKLQNVFNFQTSGFTNLHIDGTTNGSLTIRVLTKLQGPVTPASIQLQVFVAAADNFEFANPDEEYTPANLLSTFAPQAEQVQDAVVVMGNRVSSPPAMQYLEYMGEAIVSIRQLLRRMTKAYTESAVGTTSSGLLAVAFHTQSRFPAMFGYDPNGFDQANSITGGSAANFNFVPRHPMAWVMAGFVGVRGSTHWNYLYDSTSLCTRFAAFRDTGAPNATSWASTTFLNPSDKANYNRLLLLNDFAGSSGQSLTSQGTQPSLSVRYPFYSQYKFQSASPLYSIGGNVSTPVTANDNAKQRVSVVVTTPTARQTWASSMMYTWASIGVDFDLIWFLNAPTIYKYNSLPTAV